MDYYIFKDRLNKAMKYRELTASELARKSGLDKGSISPHLHHVKALCRKRYEAFSFCLGEVLGKF